MVTSIYPLFATVATANMNFYWSKLIKTVLEQSIFYKNLRVAIFPRLA